MSKKELLRMIFCGPFNCLHTRLARGTRNRTAMDVLAKYCSTSVPEHREKASLYVHWPYCSSRCSYCNFNKYIKQNVDHERMKKCLVTEAKTLLKESNVKTITSVFFGGGTPSLAEPATFAAVLDTVSSCAYLPSGAEVTMEANPTSTESQMLSEFKAAGVNRLSLGIQSLEDTDLEILGREHSVADALKCLESSRHLFPGRTSIDLIFGLPGQDGEKLSQQLGEALRVCDDHISLYQLTLERGTSLFTRVMDRDVALPTQDMMAELYETAVKILEENGFVRYEASNFARNGAESSHNKSYWNGSQYIGIGPGAHGRFVSSHGVRQARIQTLEPEPWMIEVERDGHGTRKVTPQTTKDVLQEILMLGLRTKEGLKTEVWSQYSPHGMSLAEVFLDTYFGRLLQEEEFIVIDGRGIRCTAKGLNVVDSIVPELLNVLDKFWEVYCESDV